MQWHPEEEITKKECNDILHKKSMTSRLRKYNKKWMKGKKREGKCATCNSTES